MFDRVFIFKEIKDDGPVSNNYSKSPMMIQPNFGLSLGKFITVSEIDEDCDNYAYIINHGYDRDFGNLSLVEYIKRYNVIPEQVRSLLRKNKCILVLDSIYEGYCSEEYLKKMYEVIDYFSLGPGQFVYVTAGTGVPNINKGFCRERKLRTPVEVISIPLFRNLMKTYGSVGSNDKQLITKKFICLNNSLRLHRMVFGTTLFFKKHLLNETFFSFPYVDSRGDRFDDIIRRNIIPLRNVIADLFPTRMNFGESIYDMQRALPITLDHGPVLTFDPIEAQINWFYDRSLFNIVTETTFYESVVLGCPDLFLSEKIFKPMLYLQIPIVLGGPGLVQELRNLGFDVFDDIVDHSYDMEYNHNKRMAMVFEQLEKINAKYSIEDLNKLSLKIMDRLKTNRDKLLT